MFIYNLKFNKKNFAKFLFIIIGIIITIYFFVSAFKIYKNTFKVKDENKNEISYIEPRKLYKYIKICS